MADNSSRQLIVLMEGRRAGTIEQGANGRLSFRYEEEWRASANATPLSLSMQRTRRLHDDAVVRPFLWGLLPDNERVLERWARHYQVSAGNPFALLRHVGEDCAGAAQLVVPERVEAALHGDGGVTWFDDDELADRLRLLRKDPTSWHVRNTGQFSLAGAQAKTALYFEPGSGRWGEPWGAVPTTHILKPAVAGLDEHDLNEHLCLVAAGLAGLPAANSAIVTFKAERAIAIERYDRRAVSGQKVVRVHQEDACQALAIAPTAKYQNEGGPTPERIVELLGDEVRPQRLARVDIARFVDALAFNWIIAGTDAHAKNYSLLLAGPQVRLAPLYDIASALPYDDMYLPKLRMAMKVGGEYGIESIGAPHWRQFAVDNQLEPDEAIGRIDDLAARTPECFEKAAHQAEERASPLADKLVARVAARAASCRKSLRR